MIDRTTRWLAAGYVAGLAFVVALLIAGSNVEGYDHARHSVGVLGSGRSPEAFAFRAVGFVVPGVMLMAFGLALRRRLRLDGAGAVARIGADLQAISGLAFWLQAAFGLDLANPDEAATQGHVVAHGVALLAAWAAMVAFAAGLRRLPRWRPLAIAGALGAVALAGLLAWPPHLWLPGWAGASGASQRLALAVYFAVPAFAAALALRRQPPL